MKPASCMGIAAIALMSSLGVAAAAGSSTSSGSMSKPNSMQSSSQAPDKITLTKAQKHTIWQDVSKQQNAAKTPVGFNPQVGAKVPGSVYLHPLPTSVTNTIAATRPYEYAMLDKTLLIVNPTDKKIVDIITQSS